MSQYWYLVASFPMLHLGEKPPMDTASFRAACAGHLSEEETASVEALLDNREPPAGPASNVWNAEIQLRDAVVRVRAKNRGTDANRFLQPYEGFDATVEKMVTDAFTRANPLEQEMELDRVRWMLADELALTDPFGLPAVLAYALKVRIADRWAQMDEGTGKEKVEELILAATAENPETGIEV